MIDLDEVEAQITRREMGDTTWANCQALAVLYSIRDHLGRRGEASGNVPQTAARDAGETVETVASGGSEFLDVCDGLDVSKVLGVIDSHMSAIRVVFPREYDSVINRLKSVSSE